jgi:hypothetical protein
MFICCRLTTQARAAAAAAAAVNFSSPEQLNHQQQQHHRPYSKPSSLDVLSESAASQVEHTVSFDVSVCMTEPVPVSSHLLQGTCPCREHILQMQSVSQAESDESFEPHGGRATSASAEGALVERPRHSGSKRTRTPTSSAPGVSTAKRPALAAMRSPGGVSLTWDSALEHMPRL